MILADRYENNPIITPDIHTPWENLATFNGSVVKQDDMYHIVYRALSKESWVGKDVLQLSTVGYATSKDGKHWENRKQLLGPEYPWEIYGCEDPRITYFEGKYYIFYTALSTFPFGPDGIKVALATTTDFQKISDRKLITPFNAKAACLFPDRINGKIAMMLTANTDRPPSQISIAYFDSEEEIAKEEYWNNWYETLPDHALNLKRSDEDHVEIGAPPIKTDKGWLLIYSHIRNYFSKHPIFGIEAVLLDLANPQKIIGRTNSPLIVPREEYELYGIVPNIVFPSGALIEDDTLSIYYGGADTRVCVASCSLSELLEEIIESAKPKIISNANAYLKRYDKNPILLPIEEHEWERKAAFNPTALLVDDTVHIVYRGWSETDVSTMGYATSKDGFTIDERLPDPIYIPRADFELSDDNRNNGCEDGRLTFIDGRVYNTYTAYDGHNPPRVGLSSIAIEDFLEKKWHNWAQPILISPPGIDDKDCAILPKKINGKYMVYHRIDKRIWIDFVDSLAFPHDTYIQGFPWLSAREGKWDDLKIGIAGPPIETEQGWIFMYHGISSHDNSYRLGALLLDLNDPTKIISRIDDPILEPVEDYERDGWVPNVVFPCGAVIKDNNLLVYYGGADKVVGVAYCDINEFLGKFE
ncbi:MAG TPA: hypothetical protein PLD54_02135 [Candidatus Levybacteria bacterium]|nr:hypothetical protein [Candidatus Levybacteria bacterium]